MSESYGERKQNHIPPAYTFSLLPATEMGGEVETQTDSRRRRRRIIKDYSNIPTDSHETS